MQTKAIVLLVCVLLISSTDVVALNINPKPSVSSYIRDVDCLSKAVFHEAQSQSRKGKRAVAEVIINRTNSPFYPNNVCDVVLQPKQFSGFTNKEPEIKNDVQAKAWREALDVSWAVLLKGNTLLSSDVLHFHSINVHPYWIKSMKRAAKHGAHIFYKNKRQVVTF